MSRAEAMAVLKKGTVIPATPLALDDNGNFDEAGQRLLMRYYLNAGAGGIATAVHTTQFEIRDPKVNLFEKVLTTVIDEIQQYEAKSGRTVVRISGVCGDTAQAVSEAETAKRLGYDAVLLSPGGLGSKSEAELIERTRAVAKVMPVIAFYLQTAVGGRRFTYNYWEQICAIDGVAAIKCAAFDRYATLDVVRAAAFSERSNEIALYTGNDDNIVVELMTKFKFMKDGRELETEFAGGLLGHWSVWTKRVCEMFSMIKSSKANDELLTLAAKVTDANSAFFDTANGFKGCIAGVHEVLHRQGLMKCVRCINKDEVLSSGQSEEIDRVYKMYPELNDDDFVMANIEKWKEGV